MNRLYIVVGTYWKLQVSSWTH